MAPGACAGHSGCPKILEAARTKLKSEGSLAECWSLYGTARDLAETLFGEILAFVVGVLTRAKNLDNGMFPIADELISSWPSGSSLAPR